ncbi:GNAT family N-acetyltransferase [Occultella gossypii]|uniref:GNAT family N-acetyltransferase n=1 Tax=Occultella gossypii TaxID=2800820 RepID=A0ABS7S9N9_9MICO|nr:GNAT family N-acetyltransferase [Occultella gossypii]MBZ2197059.1 GNAT family N-acetyltransferase [Occultella gossypii]
MHELTQTVWGGRSYFVMPSLESCRAWVRESDPALFLLASTSDGLAGYVAAFEQEGELVIDDIQVGPAQRRQGIGTFLLARILAEARRRRIGRVHLETEGDDPVGARAFYERLGFSSAADDLRFRKSVALTTAELLGGSPPEGNGSFESE